MGRGVVMTKALQKKVILAFKKLKGKKMNEQCVNDVSPVRDNQLEEKARKLETIIEKDNFCTCCVAKCDPNNNYIKISLGQFFFIVVEVDPTDDCFNDNDFFRMRLISVSFISDKKEQEGQYSGFIDECYTFIEKDMMDRHPFFCEDYHKFMVLYTDIKDLRQCLMLQ